ncbi:lytic transglycosylase domain-containing protein [Shimia abyssi]|uniref:Transglycosylase-like protein with SLT domain n=1 Tax=Shimia abyssi TaxID=1662395 RepID=A0A2P8FFU2_9RHOB|nr:lytic transglycosylase domain-containing protein [Shimia abyssi]PSL20558.1 transglycosylase-like protein with SLT domain [Shimia abyssi]
MKTPPTRRHFVMLLAAAPLLAACGGRRDRRQDRKEAKQIRKLTKSGEPPLYPNETPELRKLINKYADFYDVPRPLVQRVIVRESTHRPWATNGPNIGLMQIQLPTARGMGYRGDRAGLLDAETNLKYAVKYLRGAYIVADGDYDDSVKWYARGYYYEAKRKGLLQETGLRP